MMNRLINMNADTDFRVLSAKSMSHPHLKMGPEKYLLGRGHLPISRFLLAHRGDRLETKRRAQIYRAAISADAKICRGSVAGPIYHAECSGGYVRVRNAPAWMIKEVISAGEQLELHPLLDSDGLADRHVPNKRISVGDEENLSE